MGVIGHAYMAFVAFYRGYDVGGNGDMAYAICEFVAPDSVRLIMGTWQVNFSFRGKLELGSWEWTVRVP